ncbi:hypothetical protein BJ138DRAFT_1076281 [Hygrophoropsis aurantiaca]|uniref:Uncharacterized protein n=1 Tax=Hygrophoropsis aurantiaca TaxID=72124 RepID=A0ACB8ARQ8_9AGAM|nr:hypothetical protein BJ138DRAFT_1076281 [Hygrophoropsis aurantiaca]
MDTYNSQSKKRTRPEKWDFLDLTGSSPVYRSHSESTSKSTAKADPPQSLAGTSTTSKVDNPYINPTLNKNMYQPRTTTTPAYLARDSIPSYPSPACPSTYAASMAYAQPPPKKRAKKAKNPDEPAPEKRGAMFKKRCPQNILERVDRVMSQRFFMIDRARNGNDLCETFKVLGSTGNVYTVKIDKTPSCDCPDARKGNHCKHILFIYLKVLQVPQESSTWYQKALLTSELEEVFAHAPVAPNSVAQQRVRDAFARATGAKPAAVPEDVAKKRKMPGPEDDCPICYENMHNAPATTLVWCETCGNGVHKECFGQWARSAGHNLTCVFCRAAWVDTSSTGNKGKGKGKAVGARSEGYLNLGAVAGLSQERDMSSYYQGPRQGERHYGYQAYDDDYSY